MCRLSVILPVYNGERYIAEAVNSILTQTELDLEILVLNDGSIDGTDGVLRKLATQDARIRYFSRENRGLVASLNELVDLSRGDFIARMDADDVALPHRLATQIEYMERTATDACGTWVEWIGEAELGAFTKPVDHCDIERSFIFDTPFWHPTVVLRRELRDLIRYETDFKDAEDTRLWGELLLAGVRMANVPKVLLKYRIHDAQVSNIHNHNQLANLERIKLDFMLRHPVYSQLGTETIAFWASLYTEQEQSDVGHRDCKVLYEFVDVLHSQDYLPPQMIFFRALLAVSRKVGYFQFLSFVLHVMKGTSLLNAKTAMLLIVYPTVHKYIGVERIRQLKLTFYRRYFSASLR
jgi:glycosyltransferase involved in cell wall biosynthesis